MLMGLIITKPREKWCKRRMDNADRSSCFITGNVSFGSGSQAFLCEEEVPFHKHMDGEFVVMKINRERIKFEQP